ncbi:alpha-amylase family glycosyl hydrolase [Psychromonas antarctica]|uniref:alpha-amylase family glycosyl hydrolase n=1 Tax=Psychromonas antarctica TaxID=67573 RepID=UPI001EE94A8B|nr:alpha-amylase family glycosyl hydrolase [Psychromonas antarctica]MCG6200629.1 alpha-amylase [Psychromonas antarctica]
MSRTKEYQFEHVEWSKAANIYEVNIRQFTPEGTFNAFRSHLPRLKKMGVDILWFMPIHPVGIKNRKGTLGSGYSVKDYYQVNPEFGSLDDFKALVQEIHSMGMYVLIDWVANHTAWDNCWVTEHPEWYKKNEKGEIHSYIYDNGKELEYWDDVVGLDYKHPKLWDAMINALSYWVKFVGIDGYRCDVAGLVPVKFWEKARAELDSIKPIFMLAEWSSPELHNKAFDMTYDWGLYDVMSNIVKGKSTALAIREHVELSAMEYPEDAYRMAFTTNHDKNSWDECDTKLYGHAFKAYSVLAMTLLGMPLIYSGQESGLDKQLSFFAKEDINWKAFQYDDFYKQLLMLKKNNPALWNGQYGAKTQVLEETSDTVFCFSREKDKNSIVVMINLSDRNQQFYSKKLLQEIKLKPFEYKITTSNQSDI